MNLKRNQDKGCELCPSCLECKADVCREEAGRSNSYKRNVEKEKRDNDVRTGWLLGESKSSLAKRFSVSERTIHIIVGGK